LYDLNYHKILSLISEKEFTFAYDLLKGANDRNLYDALIEGSHVDEGVLHTPNWVGWESDRNSFFLKILEIAPENERIRSLRKETTLLDLRFFGQESFPSEVLQFTNLQYLHLRGGVFKTIPSTIEILKSLTDLNLESVGLKNIPRELSSLVTLRRLDLTGNDFSAGNIHWDVLQKLQNMEILILSWNQISTINEFQWLTLPYLKSLTLNGNCLHKVTIQRFFHSISQKIPNLRELFLRGCCIDKLPELREGLNQLIKLDLGDNYLHETPQWIDKLSTLKWLNLQGNPLAQK
jgi:Leucine-rich repeat (LRR) protein